MSPVAAPGGSAAGDVGRGSAVWVGETLALQALRGLAWPDGALLKLYHKRVCCLLPAVVFGTFLQCFFPPPLRARHCLPRSFL